MRISKYDFICEQTHVWIVKSKIAVLLTILSEGSWMIAKITYL